MEITSPALTIEDILSIHREWITKLLTEDELTRKTESLRQVHLHALHKSLATDFFSDLLRFTAV
jgi:hypothetical protein